MKKLTLILLFSSIFASAQEYKIEQTHILDNKDIWLDVIKDNVRYIIIKKGDKVIWTYNFKTQIWTQL